MTDYPATELADAYRRVAQYYTQKIRRHGPSPLGVDWSCVPTQALRFRKLLTLCDLRHPISLNDVGCGYGALLDYLALYHPQSPVDYLGIDLSPAMIRSARKRWSGDLIQFHLGAESPRAADYSIASGIFNVMLDQSVPVWEKLIERTMTHLNATSRKGFSVNFVRQSSSRERARMGLYCTTPEQWGEFCKTHFSSKVRVIEGYGMSEFTLLVEPS